MQRYVIPVVGRRTFETNRRIGPKDDPYELNTIGVETTYVVPWSKERFKVRIALQSNGLENSSVVMVDDHRLQEEDPVARFEELTGLSPARLHKLLARKYRPDIEAAERAAGWSLEP